MIASLLFSQFIWRLAPIPSSAYPYAQELWHLQALNSLLMQTSTLEGNSLFFQALNWIYVGPGRCWASSPISSSRSSGSR